MIEPREIPEHEHPLIAGIDLIERRSQPLDLIGRLDSIEVVDHGSILESVRCSRSTVAALSTEPPVVISELVGSDPEEPRREPASTPGEVVETTERSLEGGRGDVVGHARVTAATIGKGVDSVDVGPVELSKRVGIDTRPIDELSLVGQVTVAGTLIHRSPG